MKVFAEPDDMQAESLRLRREGVRIGLVPTMGYLHEGHLSLVRIAREHCDVAVVSVFVNPTQFGPGEDLDSYPRDFERDRRLCEQAGTAILFCPSADSMYRPAHSVYVQEESLSRGLCGASRPTHFCGVTTVVAKLFNIVLPHVAVFGRKDAQQARILERMVRDLNFPVRLLVGPIVREPDGLAMSSRNRYLSPRERRDALCLRKALLETERLYGEGERSAAALRARMETIIRQVDSATIDYLAVVDYENLQPLETVDRPALVAVAARVGATRLIDNTLIGIEENEE